MTPVLALSWARTVWAVQRVRRKASGTLFEFATLKCEPLAAFPESIRGSLKPAAAQG
jgi:hypothetical protein